MYTESDKNVEEDERGAEGEVHTQKKKWERGNVPSTLTEDDPLQRSRLFHLTKSIFNQCHMLNATAGIDFAITFQSLLKDSQGLQDKLGVKYLMCEARSKGFNRKSFFVAEEEKEPYIWKGLKPDYCKSWTDVGEFDSASKQNPETESQQNDTPTPSTETSKSFVSPEVSDRSCSSVGSDFDLFNLQNCPVSNVEEIAVLSAPTLPRVRLDKESLPDGVEDKKPLSVTDTGTISDCTSLSAVVKAEDTFVENGENWPDFGSDYDLITSQSWPVSNLNEISALNASSPPDVKVDEESQPERVVEDKKTLSCTSNIVINAENDLAEREELFRCDHCEEEFSEFNQLGSHIEGHFSGNASSTETPCFKISFGADDYNQEKMLQENKSLALTGSAKFPEIHNSSTDSIICNSSGVRCVDGVSGFLTSCSTHDLLKEEPRLTAEITRYPQSPRPTPGNKPHDLFRCDHCQKQFSELDNLRSHIIIHLKEGEGSVCELEKSYICVICDRRFFTVDERNRHVRTHTGEKNFPCELCKKRFSNAYSRTRHIRTHTGEKHICVICDRRFFTVDERNRHVRTHTVEKNFPCKLCKKRFSNPYSRTRHIRTHTGEKPFTCDFCNKKFSELGNCKVHIRTHIGEKPYICDICDTRFFTADHRNKHVRTHTGDKNFPCEFCKKRFSTASNRTKHIRTHTGEKPFTCGFCDRRFSHSSSRNAHVRTHTGEKPYICDICDTRFSTASQRDRHVRTHTGEKPYL